MADSIQRTQSQSSVSRILHAARQASGASRPSSITRPTSYGAPNAPSTSVPRGAAARRDGRIHRAVDHQALALPTATSEPTTLVKQLDDVRITREIDGKTTKTTYDYDDGRRLVETEIVLSEWSDNFLFARQTRRKVHTQVEVFDAQGRPAGVDVARSLETRLSLFRLFGIDFGYQDSVGGRATGRADGGLESKMSAESALGLYFDNGRKHHSLLFTGEVGQGLGYRDARYGERDVDRAVSVPGVGGANVKHMPTQDAWGASIDLKLGGAGVQVVDELNFEALPDAPREASPPVFIERDREGFEDDPLAEVERRVSGWDDRPVREDGLERFGFDEPGPALPDEYTF